MNEMELLRQVARETPLPATGELDAARARLVAAITADPATHAIAVAPVTMGQASPSVGQAVDLLRPAAPAPVLSAVRFMYGGAAGSAVVFLAVLPFIGGTLGHWNGHPITATPLSICVNGSKPPTGPRPPRKPAMQSRPRIAVQASESISVLVPTNSSTASTPRGSRRFTSPESPGPRSRRGSAPSEASRGKRFSKRVVASTVTPASRASCTAACPSAEVPPRTRRVWPRATRS